MDKVIRVLWFTNIPMPDVERHFGNDTKGSGGWMGALLELLKSRQEVKIGVVTACPQYPDLHMDAEGVEYFNIHQKQHRYQPMLYSVDENPVYLHKCLEIIREFKPDVIHIHGTERFFGELAVPGMVNCPAVISIQGILTDCSKWHNWFGSWSLINFLRYDLKKNLVLRGYLCSLFEMKKRAVRERRLFSTCEHFIGRTRWDHAYVRHYNLSARYDSISEVIREPFWNSSWNINQCRRHRIVFTNVSHPRKGAELLIEAVKSLKYRYPDIELCLIGAIADDGYGKSIKREISKLGGHVTMLGKRSGEEIAEILKEAHVYVSASYIDNSPNSLAEAQIVGLPVVASYTGGVPSMVENGKTGLLFPVGDGVSLCSAITEIFDHDTVAVSLGNEARQAARMRHCPLTIVNRHLDVYSGLSGIGTCAMNEDKGC